MKTPKYLSNKEKRVAYINSLPLKKVAKKLLLKEFKEYIKNCKKMAEHPLRKNFPFSYARFTRKINNNVWEVVSVRADYTKKHGLILNEPRLMYRHLTTTNTFYNNTSGMGWNRFPRVFVDTRESKNLDTYSFNNNPVIPTRFLSQYGHIPNEVISNASVNLLNSPLFETTYKTKSKGFFTLFRDYSILSAKTYLQAFPFLRSKQELKEFEKLILKTTIHFHTYQDFVAMARKHNDPIFIPNYQEKHDEYIRIATAKKEAKNKIIEKKLKEMKKTVFKANPKKIKYRFFQPKTKKDLKEIGKDMSICVGAARYDPKEIILATLNDYMVCIQYSDKKFRQIRTYKNYDLPDNIEKQLRKEVLKWQNTNI